MAQLEAARKERRFKVIGLLPDACFTPGCSQPVPYQIVADFEDGTRHSDNVNFAGYPTMNMNSRVVKVTGNEPGTGGGVKSGVNKAYCRPINGKPTVNVNRHHVLYSDLTYMWMNCNGPDGPGNTIGKLVYQDQIGQAATAPGAKVTSSDPPVSPETVAEKSFLSGSGPMELTQQLSSPDGIVGLAKMAPSLASTDWSDPGAALGALGGLAGLGGMDGLAQLAGLGGTALSTDWSNPGAALGALSGLAGMGGMGGLAQIAGLGSQAYNLSKMDFSNPGALLGAATTIAGLGTFSGEESSPKITPEAKTL